MNKIKHAYLLAAAIAVLPLCAPAQDVTHCRNIENPDDRLNCFDQAFLETETVVQEADVEWRVETTTSPLDDTTSVTLELVSEQPIRGRLGTPEDAILYLRCMENRTSAFIYFGGLFMVDSQGRGRVDYRVDDREAANVSMGVSTNNHALGIWQGAQAIPFIRDTLIGGQNLYVRATPYNESAVQTNFNISGLHEAITPLREACGW